MAHRKRVSAYRRQGVSAFAYRLKVNIGERISLYFLYPERASVSAYRRIGVTPRGASKLHLPFQVHMRDLSKRG
jgi:hypothetical protein